MKLVKVKKINGSITIPMKEINKLPPDSKFWKLKPGDSIPNKLSEYVNNLRICLRDNRPDRKIILINITE